MANSSTIDLNKTRYTHRDYESVKKDLIDAIPSLTQEWTNLEDSDPGIVLVKLMSMFADTLSYNIDKIALELYLDSVSQRKNCSKILALLGYKMHWYRSARVVAHVRLNPTSPYLIGNINPHVKLKPFETIFHAGQITYTVINSQLSSLEEIDINSTENALPVYLVEGTPKESSFNKTALVNNRFYFPISDIDESIILLTVRGANSPVLTCELVDNLYLNTSSDKLYFEFNVDEYDRPYIQLPDYWTDITGTDSCIFTLKYLESSGVFGNISSNAFTDVSGDGLNIKDLIVTNLVNSIQYSSENGNAVVESFNSPGIHPENIEVARRSAANYVFTHDTLVTPSDFEKACLREFGITMAKLVDSQIILNDNLDLDEIKNRCLDEFKTVLLELPSEVKPDEADLEYRLAGYLAILYLIYRNFDKNYNYYFNSDVAKNSIYNLNYGNINDDGDPYNQLYWSRSELQDVSVGVTTYYFNNRPYPVNEDEVTVYLYKLATNSTPSNYSYFKYVEKYNIMVDVTKSLKSTDNPYELGLYSRTIATYNYDPSSHSFNIDTDLTSYSKIELARNYGPSLGYYPYKPNEVIQKNIFENLNRLKMLNVNLGFGTTKVFPFKVKGTLHLIDQMDPKSVLQIIDRVDDALTAAYYPDKRTVGERPDFVKLVDIIQHADSKIKYFDATGNIVEWAPEVRLAMNRTDDVYETFIADGDVSDYTLMDGAPDESTMFIVVTSAEKDSKTGSIKYTNISENCVWFYSSSSRTVSIRISTSDTSIIPNKIYYKIDEDNKVFNKVDTPIAEDLSKYYENIPFGATVKISNGNTKTHFENIFDTTSAIMYNGLKETSDIADEILHCNCSSDCCSTDGIFNLHPRYLKFRFRNVSTPLDEIEKAELQIEGSETGAYVTPTDYGTAYLINYSEACNLNYIKKISSGNTEILQLNNISELRALCLDIVYRGIAKVRYKRRINKNDTSSFIKSDLSALYSLDEFFDDGYTSRVYHTNNPDKDVVVYPDEGYGYLIKSAGVTYEGNLRYIISGDTKILVTVSADNVSPEGTVALDEATLDLFNEILAQDIHEPINFLFDQEYRLTTDQVFNDSTTYYEYDVNENTYKIVEAESGDTVTKSGVSIRECYIRSTDADRSLNINYIWYNDEIDDGTPLASYEVYAENNTLINNTGLQYLEEL